MKHGWIVASIVLAASPIALAAQTGKAVLHATSKGSPLSGTATLEQTQEGLKIAVSINHAPAGQHGLHIHQFGSCNEAGKAAGGHYNPQNVKHGLVTKDGLGGAHPGDLGNIDIGQDGSGTLEATLPNVRLTGASPNVAGRAIVLHEKADDFSQPTGNAGGRIACGPIVVTGE